MLTGRRLILAGEFWFGSTCAGIANGLRTQGWAVEEVDLRLFFGQPATLLTKAALRVLKPWNTRQYNEAILQAVERLRPDAFLTVKGSFVLPELLKKLSTAGVATINYYPDYHFDHKDLDETALSRFDLLLTTKSFHIHHLQNWLGAGRTAFLHHGYSDRVHYPHKEMLDEDEYLADVTYVGNYSPNKEKWLQVIARRLPNIDLRIIGSRWETSQDERIRRCSVGHVLNGDSYAIAIQHSRLNIAVHGDLHQPTGWQDLVSTRTFEIPACKGLMLHVDNAEVRGLFEPGTEIAVFGSEDELIANIKYHLDRPQLRAEMIQKAYQRCVPSYGYNSRAEVLSDTINALLSKRNCAPQSGGVGDLGSAKRDTGPSPRADGSQHSSAPPESISSDTERPVCHR